MRRMAFLLQVLFVGFLLTIPIGHAAEGNNQGIRLFYTDSFGEKQYYTGFDWVRLGEQEKMHLIEQARQGALRINVVVTMPAEVYVKALDEMFVGNSAVRHIEIGQAIQGAAISIKDWGDGSDPEKMIDSFLEEDATAQAGAP